MSTEEIPGLRVYTSTDMEGYYTQCGEEPYYRWYYDEEARKWCGSLLQAAPGSLTEVHIDIPPELQTEIVEHYSE